MIKLGSKVRDTLTGYSGLATARSEYLYGCVRICIHPAELDKEGKVQDGEWFDEQRVEVLKELAPKVSDISSAVSGGPYDAPKRQTDPTR